MHTLPTGWLSGRGRGLAVLCPPTYRMTRERERERLYPRRASLLFVIFILFFLIIVIVIIFLPAVRPASLSHFLLDRCSTETPEPLKSNVT